MDSFMLAPWKLALTSLGSRRIVVLGYLVFRSRTVLYCIFLSLVLKRLICRMFSTTAIDHLLYVCLENEVCETANGVETRCEQVGCHVGRSLNFITASLSPFACFKSGLLPPRILYISSRPIQQAANVLYWFPCPLVPVHFVYYGHVFVPEAA